MKKILIIGSAHVDFVSHVDKLPQGNEEFNILKQEQLISGTGFKAADVFQHFDFQKYLQLLQLLDLSHSILILQVHH